MHHVVISCYHLSLREPNRKRWIRLKSTSSHQREKIAQNLWTNQNSKKTVFSKTLRHTETRIAVISSLKGSCAIKATLVDHFSEVEVCFGWLHVSSLHSTIT